MPNYNLKSSAKCDDTCVVSSGAIPFEYPDVPAPAHSWVNPGNNGEVVIDVVDAQVVFVQDCPVDKDFCLALRSGEGVQELPKCTSSSKSCEVESSEDDECETTSSSKIPKRERDCVESQTLTAQVGHEIKIVNKARKSVILRVGGNGWLDGRQWADRLIRENHTMHLVFTTYGWVVLHHTPN